MTAILIGKMNLPNYIFNTSDVQLDGTVTGISVIGYTALNVDSGAWFVVKNDRTLESFALPIEATITGNVVVGEVGIHQPVADAISVSPHYNTQSVGTSGVAQPLVSSATYAISLLVFPKPANTSSIYFGTSAVNKTNSKQIVIAPSTGVVSIDAPIGYKLGVNTFFVDSDVNGEGVNFMYLG